MMSPHPAQKGFTSHLHWLAMQEINAERSENPDRARRVIANTIDAVPYEPEMIDAPDANLLYERREDYVPREMLPAGVLMLTAGVDVQKDRLEVSIWGWGDNREGWALEHRQVRGAYNDPKTWANLEQYLTEAEFQHPLTEDPLRVLGTRPKVFVDAGHWTDTVLGWTRPRSRLGIYASQGSPTINAPLVGRKRKNAVPACWVYPLGVNQGKENLYHRLSLSPPAEGEAFPPGYLHFPAAADLVYFDQLTAEIGKEETFRGEVYTRYVCQKGKRNEALDCAVYAMAAANARRFNYAATADNLAQKKSKPTTKSGTFSEERRHRQPLRSRSSWMNTGSGWKI